MLKRTTERHLQRRHAGPVAGVDEVGRGPLAGPVVACACVLPALMPAELAAAIDDSKRLTRARREALAEQLHAAVRFGIGAASHDEIDTIGIVPANDLAMRRALEALDPPPAAILIDGPRLPPGLVWPGEALIDADALEMTVAAASIIAKVHRDRLMAEACALYPGYGFARHVGYASAAHRQAILELGPSPIHRRSFLRKLLAAPVATPAPSP